MTIKYYGILFLRQLIIVLAISGCASALPTYKEPDPQQDPTARLRISVYAGVSAEVSIHANNNRRDCLLDSDFGTLPVRTNVSGFGWGAGRKIGMPLENSYLGKIGAEMFIPANGDLTFSAVYSGHGSLSQVSCHEAFRFAPIKNSDYELVLMAGVGSNGRPACDLSLKKIVPHSRSGVVGYQQEPVKYTPVAVKGSNSWPYLCQ